MTFAVQTGLQIQAWPKWIRELLSVRLKTSIWNSFSSNFYHLYLVGQKTWFVISSQKLLRRVLSRHVVYNCVWSSFNHHLYLKHVFSDFALKLLSFETNSFCDSGIFKAILKPSKQIRDGRPGLILMRWNGLRILPFVRKSECQMFAQLLKKLLKSLKRPSSFCQIPPGSTIWG